MAVIRDQRPGATISEFVVCHDFIVVLSSSARSIAEVSTMRVAFSSESPGLGLPRDRTPEAR